MAKINIEIDTSKKTGKVTVDGKKVDNVAHVWYSSEDSFGEFGVEITSREVGDDITKVTRLVADEDGLMISEPSSVGRLDISKMLERKWCNIN